MDASMHATAPGISRAARVTGRALSTVAILFLGFSAAVKLLGTREAAASFAELGYPAGVGLGIGVLELACTLLYAWKRTAVLGAVLLTGYLGGAVATHLRLLHPWASHTLFPLYVGALLWGGLALRDRRIRTLL